MRIQDFSKCSAVQDEVTRELEANWTVDAVQPVQLSFSVRVGIGSRAVDSRAQGPPTQSRPRLLATGHQSLPTVSVNIYALAANSAFSAVVLTCLNSRMGPESPPVSVSTRPSDPATGKSAQSLIPPWHSQPHSRPSRPRLPTATPNFVFPFQPLFTRNF
ncbi:unnamed protein product [Protopolystoma xenopodis]|uniref:Uncharacterized protein n=1 Tax=Protopolystoma xenopodis TaxID=117903 RepID=A0A3S5C0Q0_9PLAT|nr:unnamed protein product [Protopolystoma xenopodis]